MTKTNVRNCVFSFIGTMVFVLTVLLGKNAFSQELIYNAIKEKENDKVVEWFGENKTGNVSMRFKNYSNFVNERLPIYKLNCVIDTMSLLSLSIFHNNEELTKKFLTEPVFVGDTTELSNAMNVSVFKNNYEQVILLHNMGAVINKSCDFCYKKTTLQVALGNQVDKNVLEYVLENSDEDDFKKIDCFDNTMLHYLVENNDVILLEKYFDYVAEFIMEYDAFFQLPFEIAIQNENPEIIKFIWERMLDHYKVVNSYP